MIKIYDVICKDCGKVEEQWIENGENFKRCSVCGGPVKRIYSTFNFKLKYDPKKDKVGWSFNNYDRSHYWDEVNKERKEGKDVRPFKE